MGLVLETVALVGDSIRISYQPHVAVRVRSHPVWGPARDCQSSRFLLANIDELVLSRLHGSTLVHINSGSNDVERRPDANFEAHVGPHEYHRNMTDIIKRVSHHPLVGAVVVATTTPIDDIRHKSTDTQRHNEDVIAYNEFLVDAAAAAHCYINDLYEAVRRCRFDPLAADGVNFNAPGVEYLGSQVAEYLRPLLA